jgi:hypothetical protein
MAKPLAGDGFVIMPGVGAEAEKCNQRSGPGVDAAMGKAFGYIQGCAGAEFPALPSRLNIRLKEAVPRIIIIIFLKASRIY